MMWHFIKMPRTTRGRALHALKSAVALCLTASMVTCQTPGAALPAWTTTRASLCLDVTVETDYVTNFSACYALCAKTAGCSQFAATNADWSKQMGGPACNLAPPCAKQCNNTPPWMPGRGYCKQWDTYTCTSGPAALCAPPVLPCASYSWR